MTTMRIQTKELPSSTLDLTKSLILMKLQNKFLQNYQKRKNKSIVRSFQRKKIFHNSKIISLRKVEKAQLQILF